MAFSSASTLGRLLTGELDNNKAFQAGAREIGNITDQRVQNILSRLSTTGLSRSGIGGSLLNNAYSQAGNSFADLAAQESTRRSQIINQLLGLYQFQKQFDANKVGAGDVLGGALGLLGGSALGGFGGALGDKLGKLL